MGVGPEKRRFRRVQNHEFFRRFMPRICFNWIVCLCIMLNIYHIMSSDDTGIDNMKNLCENSAEFRSYWVTKYVREQTIFDLGAMCLPIPPYVAFKYYLCGSRNAKKRDHPRQNRMLHRDAPAAHLLIKISDSAVAVFFSAYEETKK